MEVRQTKSRLAESEKKQSLYRDESITEEEEDHMLKSCIEILPDQVNNFSASWGSC